MNRFLSIGFVAGLLAATGLARASSGQLAPVTVHGDSFSTARCTPPDASKQCADLHAAIREHFSKREIGMLFGAAAAYQEYRTTYDRTRAKYAAFMRGVEESGLAVAVAAK